MNKFKLFLFLIFLFPSLISFSQGKVGINKTNPDESLDVDGNVNIDGNLMLNGQAGQAGQILQTNSSGTTQWVDFSEFENIQAFYINFSGNFTVPAGVTKIGVEMVGGGGAGSTTGGGSGGNYIAFTIDVTPGSIIPYVAGKGGEYNGTIHGTSSKVTIGGVVYEAHAGLGASSSQRGADNNLGSTGPAKFFRVLGQPGTANDYSFSVGPNSLTLQKIIYGSGGGTYPTLTYTQGGSRIKDFSSTLVFHLTYCTYPYTYGCGGAANSTLTIRNNGIGGYVRIYY